MKRIDKSVLFWPLLFLFCIRSVLPSFADPVPPPQRQFTILYTPMQRSEIPTVSVWINGNIHATFIIDTGTNSNLITDTLAQQLGLAPHSATKDGKSYLFNAEQAQYVVLDSAKMGTLNFSHLMCIIVKQKTLLSALGQSLIGQSIDGIIGAGDLSMFSVLCDTQSHQLTLWYPGKLTEQNIKEAGFDPSQGITLTTPEDDALYSLSAHFQNDKQEGTEKLLLDTGASYNLISNALAQQLKLKPIGKEFSDNFLSGPFPVRRAKVSEVEIGPLRLKDVEVEYPSKPKDIKLTLLGMGILSQYRFLIDYASSKVYFSAPGEEKK